MNRNVTFKGAADGREFAENLARALGVKWFQAWPSRNGFYVVDNYTGRKEFEVEVEYMYDDPYKSRQVKETRIRLIPYLAVIPDRRVNAVKSLMNMQRRKRGLSKLAA